jgi:hypothetical protein
LIVCSYPGHGGLYPYADEYWTIDDLDTIKSLTSGSNCFINGSKSANVYERSLLRYFENVEVFDQSSLSKYYSFGFTEDAIVDGITLKYPAIPSVHMDISRALAKNENKRIFIKPTEKIRCWKGASQEYVKTEQKFWRGLVDQLLQDNYLPVIWQDHSTHDMSEFSDRAAFVHENDLLVILGAMRACDCVLDVFNGISRYAYIARCPFVCCDDRQRYVAFKEYEIDDLCRVTHKNVPIPTEMVFTFSSVVQGGDWANLFRHISTRLKGFVPILNRDEWPTTLTFEEELNFDNVRKIEKKRLGTRFIKPN